MPLYYKDNNMWKEFVPNPYPIGTVVFNQDNDVSPASLVGGTWNKIDGRTLDIVNHLDSTIIKNINITLNNSGAVTGSFNVYSGNGFSTDKCTVIDDRWDVILLSGFPIPNDNIVLKTGVDVGGNGRHDRDCSIVLQTDGRVHLVFSKIISGTAGHLWIDDIGRININYSSSTVDLLANFFLYKRTA